jgi:hypothetical protein
MQNDWSFSAAFLHVLSMVRPVPADDAGVRNVPYFGEPS